MYIPLSFLGNGSVKMLERQRIHTQKYMNCWTRRFLCGQCRIKGTQAVSSSQNSLLSVVILIPCTTWHGSYIKKTDIYILLATCLLAGSCRNYFFDPEDGGDVPPKRRLKLNRLHGVISQKMILFITTAVKTSNPRGICFSSLYGEM
jgi:hypothetical protein